MDRVAVVFNPTAGQGKASGRLEELLELLVRHSVHHHLELTTYHGSAVDQTRVLARSREFSAIVAAGGDGTASEVLNGLMALPRSERPAFGILPIGRGNDMAYGLGVPADLPSAVTVVAGGHTRLCDVGQIVGGNYPEGRYFGNGVGIGFDTIVGFQAAQMKFLRGTSAYLFGAIKTMLFYYAAPLMEISDERGTSVTRALQISIMNGSRMGGVFFMAPEASPDDGKLDICMVSTPGRLAMMNLVKHYMKGTQASSLHVTMSRTGSYTVTPIDSNLAVHADGETISTGNSPLSIHLLPQQINVLNPL